MTDFDFIKNKAGARRRRHSVSGRILFGDHCENTKVSGALRRAQSCGVLPTPQAAPKMAEEMQKAKQNAKSTVLVRLPNSSRLIVSDDSMENMRNYAAKHEKYTGAARLMRELLDLNKEPPDHCSATPSSDDIFKWHANIIGAPGTPYENGVFELSITFSRKYPFVAPKVLFETPIYHCNIDRNGNVCLDLLESNWTPALSLSKLLLSIQQLMAQPNPGDPLVPKIAKLCIIDRAKYDRNAKKCTKRYAIKQASEGDEAVADADAEQKEDKTELPKLTEDLNKCADNSQQKHKEEN